MVKQGNGTCTDGKVEEYSVYFKILEIKNFKPNFKKILKTF